MSTALYRRYRPESFADVIGQEHVTEPLMQALRSGRVNHAYLFSGPRGCGKTTSARILARCLNCEQGPTDIPCGVCDSCVALARDGAGSVDVIEIDAASHGGVDDARDLRERAAFGPAQSRFKVYIIDEAHMVTPNGFNALLKVVEEPPPHVKFIFATTEPEKVLATIRSRTHHYPFHLVPPQRLTTYLEELCEQEGVQLEAGVLSFVTRAGGGSVRDSLSVLDQLISGAGEEGLTYERTAALLGFTDVELLDAVVDAVAAGDAASVFQQVDRVMESGHDPRRFVEDLLERYRDLIVLAAVGEAAGGLLPGLPPDQVERMRLQAGAYGPAGLSRAADLVATGLSEMAGAVSYRLMLELLAARLLLPAASGEEGYAVRLDRIERRLASGTGEERPGPAPRRLEARGGSQPAPASGEQGHSQAMAAASTQPQQSRPQPGGAPEGAASPQARPGALDTAAVRRQWPEILSAVRAISRRTAAGLEQAQVLDFDGQRLLVGFPDASWVRHFTGTSHEEALRQGVLDALALDTRIEATVPGADPSSQVAPRHVRPSQDPPARQVPTAAAPRSQDPPVPEPPADDGYPPPADDADQPPAGIRHQPPREGSHQRPAQETSPPGVQGSQEPAPEPTAQPAPQLPPDVPQRGRVRSRSAQAQQGSTGPVTGPTPPVRVRGRGSASGGGAPVDPDLAQQLGATRGGPGDAGPDWAQTARSSAAPSWATDAADPASAGVPTTPSPTATSPSAPVAARPEPGSDVPSDDDEDLTTSGAVGQPVIENVLGGTVIEINDEPVG